MLLLGLPDLLGLDKSPAGLLAVPGAGDGGDDPACIVVRKGVHGAVHGAVHGVHSVWLSLFLFWGVVVAWGLSTFRLARGEP